MQIDAYEELCKLMQVLHLIPLYTQKEREPTKQCRLHHYPQALFGIYMAEISENKNYLQQSENRSN